MLPALRALPSCEGHPGWAAGRQPCRHQQGAACAEDVHMLGVQWPASVTCLLSSQVVRCGRCAQVCVWQLRSWRWRCRLVGCLVVLGCRCCPGVVWLAWCTAGTPDHDVPHRWCTCPHEDAHASSDSDCCVCVCVCPVDQVGGSVIIVCRGLKSGGVCVSFGSCATTAERHICMEAVPTACSVVPHVAVAPRCATREPMLLIVSVRRVRWFQGVAVPSR